MNCNFPILLWKNMPRGLIELILDMSRELLRYQPENIYDFLANYLNALLIARDKLQTHTECTNNVKVQFKFFSKRLLKQNGFTQNIDQIYKVIETELFGAVAKNQNINYKQTRKHCKQNQSISQKTLNNFDKLNVTQEIIRIAKIPNEETLEKRLHFIIDSCLQFICRQDVALKITEFDLNWINDEVETTFNYYRKQQRIFTNNQMTGAAIIIQKSYRKYKSRLASMQPSTTKSESMSAAAKNQEGSFSRLQNRVENSSEDNQSANGDVEDGPDREIAQRQTEMIKSSSSHVVCPDIDLNDAAQIIQTAFRNYRGSNGKGIIDGNSEKPVLRKVYPNQQRPRRYHETNSSTLNQITNNISNSNHRKINDENEIAVIVGDIEAATITQNANYRDRNIDDEKKSNYGFSPRLATVPSYCK